ncbi:MAG: ribonuclease catalytic domain-containing protein [Cyanobium sp.]
MPAAPGRSGSQQRPPRPGDLVGLIEGRGAQLAVLLSMQGSRGELALGPEGRRLNVPLRRLERIASPAGCGDPSSNLLQSPWRLDAVRLDGALPAPRELASAWLLLRESAEDSPGANPPISLKAFTDLVGDSADPAQRAALWLWLQGEQTLFRWRQGSLIALAPPEIRRLRQERRRALLEAMARRSWHAALRSRQPLTCLDGLGEAQCQELAALRFWAGGMVDVPLPDGLQNALQQARCPIEPGAIRHLLVDLGQWPRHHLPALEGSRWQLGFSEEQQSEAERLLAEAELEQPGDAGRLDLTGLHTVTIDDDDTADIDDGLSLERRPDGSEWIWVHVADPGRLVEPDSPLDLEARRRASSLYLARGSLPMFPPQLATGPFSLRQGRRSAAWSLAIALAEDGSIDHLQLHRSWVRPDYRLSYSDADELIELAPPQERDLLHLHGWMQRRRAWRIARSALILDQTEGRVFCRTSEQCELEIIEPGPARTLVAEAMILAGAALADLGRRQGLALPYRSQPSCTLPTSQELSALPPGPVRHAALKRCLGRGHLGSTPSPHFSLGLDAYVQATSPIRRYGDLIVQRQLRCWLEGTSPLDGAALDALLDQLEAPIRQGIAISRDDQRHWRQVWFEQHPRLEWRAVFLRWLRPQDQLGLVYLEELALELPAHCPPRSEPGEALLVKVRELDSLRDQLRLEARR